MFKIQFYRIYFILLSIVITVFDQYSKNIISENNKSLINKNIILFSIDYVKNYGAAFNLFSGSRVFLSLVSIIITLILIQRLMMVINKKNKAH